MTDYIRRARSALHDFFRGRRDAPVDRQAPAPSLPSASVPAIPAGMNLVVENGAVSFDDPAKAAAVATSSLDAVEAALERNLPLSDSALTVVGQLAARFSPDLFFADKGARQRLLELLRPRPGLAARLGELHRAGLLSALFPEAPFAVDGDRGAAPATETHALLAIRSLEALLSDTSLTGERFGSMLREVSAPELLVLTLLLHDTGRANDAGEEAVRAAQKTLNRLQLGDDARGTVEFLIRHQLQMSLLAFRQDTGDPGVVGAFAAKFSTEERLKKLCLITVADLGAMGPDTLTPWKAELLWRLFVDTYNDMTMTYGDDVINSQEAVLTALKANRPHDISEDEIAGFLEGLPRRYLTLFEPESIYEHVRLSRQMRPDDVHFFVNKKLDVWELTVVTLDKPYLFSNICGVLSYLDLDILRGYALTSRSALVLDVFQFTDHKGCLARPPLDPLLSDVVAGRADITPLLQSKERGIQSPRLNGNPPVIYFDNDASPRYTILELVADDAPGLLHRISRIISGHGCVVDLVLISTEGGRAIDVFHMRKGSAKLTESDELALTEDFERGLESKPQNGD
jgi:[protein-PII] uridylyltransferase